MRTIRQSLITGLSVVAIGFAAILLFPKTAHGVVAALVQVVNTPASPVPIQDIDAGAHAPYQISQGFGPIATSLPCVTITLYSVPVSTPPKRFAIETVTFEADSESTDNGATLDLSTVSGGAGATHRFGTTPVPYTASIFPTKFAAHWYLSNPSVRLYADPGTNIVATECVAFSAINIPTVSISGHFVNLP
jgi:hypothetical protein